MVIKCVVSYDGTNYKGWQVQPGLETVQKQIEKALAITEEVAGKKFGDVNDPLLVSVRSGARASMPGMMDTILNLGLTDVSV